MSCGNRWAAVLFLSIMTVMGCTGASSQVKVKPALLLYDETPKGENIWPDKKLEKRFREYWSFRFADGMRKELFSMEAPYIQEMADEKKYMGYIKGSWRSELVDIQIKNVEARTEKLCFVECLVQASALPDSEKRTVYIKDWWVYAKEDWYHVLEDRFFFPELGSPDDVKIIYNPEKSEPEKAEKEVN